MARFRVPHTLVLLFGMIVVALVLAYLLPQGSFERITNDKGREQVVSGSYSHAEDPVRLNPLIVFLAIPRGFEAAQDIIFFVFLIGGTFGVLRATGAIDALIGRLLQVFSHVPQLLVAGGMLLFAAGSSTIGLAEEYLPFVPILVALAVGLGFDAVTAVGILCVGYGVGYGIAPVNPFTVIIAQEVAGLTPTSGWQFRAALSLPLLTIAFHHVWSYAQKVKADPSSSLVADVEVDEDLKGKDHPELTTLHLVSLGLTAATFLVLIYGLSQLHWYIVEMGAAFLMLSVALLLFTRLSADHVAHEFCKGAAELTSTALLIGFARSILVVLEDGGVIDTIVHGFSLPLQQVGTAFSAIGMLVVQTLCNLFIPSGSGQAYVTMPIMAPLADLVGVERQVAVLAYQFGDGFTNILVPTNPVLVGILAMARIPYGRWLRFVLPLMVKLWLAASVALAVAVWIGYS